MDQVAEKLNHPISGVAVRWLRTRVNDEVWPSFNLWTPQDEAELVRMRTAGFSLKEIGRTLHRTDIQLQRAMEGH